MAKKNKGIKAAIRGIKLFSKQVDSNAAEQKYDAIYDAFNKLKRAEKLKKKNKSK